MKQNRILKKLGIEPITPGCFQIFTASLKTILQYSKNKDLHSLKTWNAPVLPNLGKLNSDEIDFIKSEISKTKLSIDECQIQVQKLIPQNERKKFAAYYTIDQGIQFMVSVVHEYLKNSKKQKIVLADPFLGSARTLTATIHKIGVEKLQKVWGIEPLPLPALVAYASLLHATKGKKDIITVIVGDAFREIPSSSPLFTQSEIFKADIILTNPPFTRWKNLEKSYRDKLLRVVSGLGYEKYITRKEVSLQTLSMFLSDYVLNDGGLIVSVLPASTFYTIYGKGYKKLLRNKYKIEAIVESASRASFSEDSGFKEIIIVAIKGGNKDRLTVFTELNNAEKIAKAIMNRKFDFKANLFNIYNLPRFLDINWLALFGDSKLRDIVISIFKQGLKNGTLGYWESILNKESLIRGVEMYGPEFFFIPNKYWNILKSDKSSLKIQNINDETELTLNTNFLVKTLRKPSLYSRKIEIEIDSYMLSIPPIELSDLPEDLQYYIKWGIHSDTAKPAIKNYGKYWYSHVYKQMKTKRPFGKVFIPDKVDLMFKNRGVFANYTKEEVAASKNFYIVRDGNESITKFITAWFNSTIFISILILLGRRISDTWTRFLVNDYLELPMINVNAISRESILKVNESINKILDKLLPPLWDQLNEEYRYEIDLSIAKVIGIKNPERVIEELYHTLLNF
ncbi:MAG: N-6 DNA methylase [Candidatus Asgardarchaeum sp.]